MPMTKAQQATSATNDMSDDIHLLGDILGHVIRRQAGIEIFGALLRIQPASLRAAHAFAVDADMFVRIHHARAAFGVSCASR